MKLLLPDSSPRRVLILGPSGSGKSTVCERVGRILGIPVVHLDKHYWNPNWVETPKDDWVNKVKNLIAVESWAMADTLIFLDMTRRMSYFRVVVRYLKNRGKTRPDVTEGCPEKIDLDFIKWIWDYPSTRKPKILNFLEKMRRNKNVYILNNQGEIEDFLKVLRNKYGRDNII